MTVLSDSGDCSRARMAAILEFKGVRMENVWSGAMAFAVRESLGTRATTHGFNIDMEVSWNRASPKITPLTIGDFPLNQPAMIRETPIFRAGNPLVNGLFSKSGWWLGHPSEKYQSQLGWWVIPNICKNKIHGNQTTNQKWSLQWQRGSFTATLGASNWLAPTGLSPSRDLPVPKASAAM